MLRGGSSEPREAQFVRGARGWCKPDLAAGARGARPRWLNVTAEYISLVYVKVAATAAAQSRCVVCDETDIVDGAFAAVPGLLGLSRTKRRLHIITLLMSVCCSKQKSTLRPEPAELSADPQRMQRCWHHACRPVTSSRAFDMTESARFMNAARWFPISGTTCTLGRESTTMGPP